MTEASRQWRERNARGPALTAAARSRAVSRRSSGPACHACGNPLDPVLAAAGETDHPSCDPTFGLLLRLSRGGRLHAVQGMRPRRRGRTSRS